MLHRFLAMVSVWVGGVAGCRRGMPRSFSLLGFNFGVNFRFLGAFHWHFICSRMEKEDGESEWGGESCLWCLASRSVCPLKLQVMMLGCLSVPDAKSQFFPSLPSACVLRFLVRFVFVSPSQFCWLRLRLCCCVFLVAAVFPVFSLLLLF